MTMQEQAGQMMNVVIVDDEPIIRVGLRALVEWEEHGFRLVAEASDGEEALAVMERQPVDLLVTDIRMPRMDGLELIRQTRRRNEDIGIIVLSCLDDFSFVKEAMKLGARDYILKPTMEPDGLMAALRTISDSLLAERMERARIQTLNERLEQSKAYRLQATLKAYLERGYDPGELDAELNLADRRIYTVLASLPSHMSIASLDTALQDILVAVRLEDNDHLLLLDCMRTLSEHEWYQQAFSVSERLLRQWAKPDASPHSSGTYPVIYVGPPIRDWSELAGQIDYHRQQAYWRYYGSGDTQIHMDAPPLHARSGDAPLPASSRNNLLRAIAGGNQEAVRHHLNEMLAMLGEARPEPGRLHAYLLETVSLAIGYARENQYRNIGELEQKYVSLEAIAGRMLYKDVCQFMTAFIRDLFELQGGARTLQAEHQHPFIRKAIAFIREQYSSNIGTADIAEHVKLSRSYLSDLYSKETGESLIETLTKVRIEEACKLLLGSDLRIYEIAEAVGFNDSKTFAKTFKRLLGCSPKEYLLSNK